MTLGDAIETYTAALTASFADEPTVYRIVHFLLARDRASGWLNSEN